MSLPKWKDTDLLLMQEDGYKICPCDSEEQALEYKNVLKENKRCVQAGYYLGKENKPVYFVVTRERRLPNATN